MSAAAALPVSPKNATQAPDHSQERDIQKKNDATTITTGIVRIDRRVDRATLWQA